MKRFLKSKDGSTTILVVVFMIVLIIFGLTILTTSVSNIRLAEKKRDWLSDYYRMEGHMAEQIAMTDTYIGELSNKVMKAYDGDMPINEYFTEAFIMEMESLGYEIYDMDDYISIYMDYANEESEIIKHLSVELSVDKPDELSDFDELGFKIVSYTQWQEEFEYDDSIMFDDPFDEPSFNQSN